MKLILISSRLEIPNSMIQLCLFHKKCIFAKLVKYIPKMQDIRAKTLGRIIYINLVKSVRSTRYDKFNYCLLLIDNSI